jgi:hypothetical protein
MAQVCVVCSRQRKAPRGVARRRFEFVLRSVCCLACLFYAKHGCYTATHALTVSALDGRSARDATKSRGEAFGSGTRPPTCCDNTVSIVEQRSKWSEAASRRPFEASGRIFNTSSSSGLPWSLTSTLAHRLQTPPQPHITIFIPTTIAIAIAIVVDHDSSTCRLGRDAISSTWRRHRNPPIPPAAGTKVLQEKYAQTPRSARRGHAAAAADRRAAATHRAERAAARKRLRPPPRRATAAEMPKWQPPDAPGFAPGTRRGS